MSTNGNGATNGNKPQHLTGEQMLAVDLCAAGRSDREIAEELGIDRATCWRWRTSNDLFREELVARQDAMYEVARARLRALAGRALDRCEAELASEGAGGVRVALKLLELAALDADRPSPTVAARDSGAAEKVRALIDKYADRRRD